MGYGEQGRGRESLSQLPAEDGGQVTRAPPEITSINR